MLFFHCFVPKTRKARVKAIFPPKTAFSGDNPVTESYYY